VHRPADQLPHRLAAVPPLWPLRRKFSILDADWRFVLSAAAGAYRPAAGGIIA